ncbi:MAG: HAMP domain-containing histidine kinase [Kangiella sp.]|nr:HAMP domain-containing histidine kinase [Kangiella sp.]MCW9029825.1 HAMP domain-containing histidine kinase [Kangiella sp.]
MFSLLLALCFILLMISYAWIVEDNVFNRLVSSEAQFIEQHYNDTGEIASPRQPFMALHPGWESLPEKVQQLHQLSPNRVEFPNGSQGTLHLLPITLGSDQWILAADVTAFEVTRDYLPRLIPWLLLALVTVLLLAFALSRYLSRQIIQPLEYITTNVKKHSPGEPLTLKDSLPNNEIGYLAHAIQSNVKQLQTALTRETDFTRDISHELRTPATVLKMVLSRLSTTQPPDKQTLLQLRQSAQQMEQTIHVLLALAREESMQTETLCLLEEIEHCLINNQQLLHHPELQLQLVVSSEYRLVANKNLLYILLNNIIDNSLAHASEDLLNIQLKGNQLCIANPVATSSLENPLTPGVKSHNSQGIGQGLHIVNRICQIYQWQVHSYNSDNWFYLTINFSG